MARIPGLHRRVDKAHHCWRRGHRLGPRFRPPPLVQANTLLSVEEAHITEVSRSAAWVVLPRLEGVLVVRVDGEDRIIAHIHWDDKAAATDLVAPLVSLA